MSTHDLGIGNDTFPNVRADLNLALPAIASQQSGTADPPTMYSYERQARTDLGIIRRRNAANGGWVIDGTLAETFVISRSTNTILGTANHDCVIHATASFTQTLTAAATLTDGWKCAYIVDSGFTVVLDPNGAETIDGAATKSVVGPAAGWIVCDGTSFVTMGLTAAVAASDTVQGLIELATQPEVNAMTDAVRAMTPNHNKIILGTEQNSTSGTSLDFTSIPSGVRRISIKPVGSSTSGTSELLLQIGTGGSPTTSGYVSAAADGRNTLSGTSTTGFVLSAGNTAASVWRGIITLELENSANNTWVCSSSLTAGAASRFSVGTGGVSLAGVLNMLRLTTVGGTDTLDLGSINITYER